MSPASKFRLSIWPTRIRIHEIQNSFKPSVFQQQQYRTIKLWMYAKTASQVGLQNITNYRRFEISTPESCEVQLIDPGSIEYLPSPLIDDPGRMVAHVIENPAFITLPLNVVIRKHIKDGIFLGVPEDRQNTSQYYLQKVADKNYSPYTGKSLGFPGDASARRVKLLPFHPDQPWPHIQRVLKEAREWLQSTPRAVIEIHVAPSRSKGAVKNEKEVKEIPSKCLHLRPDVIKRAMPWNVKYGVHAQTNDVEYCWVLSQHEEMTRYFDDLRNAVKYRLGKEENARAKVEDLNIIPETRELVSSRHGRNDSGGDAAVKPIEWKPLSKDETAHHPEFVSRRSFIEGAKRHPSYKRLASILKG
ncbi:hypothetical protein SBOR_7649 [Sclerotinia borealis F-4128]|uniref:Uncharacterized protein n=1 Tax=Sclerotinia borealis (strain F-4128) TaxID=1432307 RepID=W9CAR8_SCLBF|nr:hypothetical protein SBOR_7649 [Sclerotinia borealis F-4128]